ncbi:T-lymphocyte surface antigen Ly-9 isoform X1 [Hemibagrus wyckioides]|uniref:T-lymphocyte surface antigen Ly-9 isoform X1 n=1 Tax=Hemibagrus wyckioides TaxID=337641 RepID=UPI00266C7EF2|nr:T-lymphocyte surface antigen Ly-9 isoform X1 [Hemibagrus wyckioides]XP_058251547.1 T-lymphocyte surface antigen Ly-9 isoform X1 [Hemibagrus wyckioides]
MRSYLHIVTFIILNFIAVDCGARVRVVYKSIGETAHLTLKEHWNITAVKWRKNHNLIATVENKNPVIKHPEKFHIHASDSSLFIHNLTVSDSGYYKAQTGQWEEDLITYNLIVQEAVSKPLINLDYQSNSSSVCHILVKCSADGDSVTYDCDPHHCTLTNATSTRANLTVNYTDTGVLECTASNRVSTKKELIHMNKSCSEKLAAPSASVNYIFLSIIICCAVVFAVLVICVITYFNNSRKKEQNAGTYQDNKGVNTVYSVVCKQPRTETPADSSAAENAVTSVYDVPSNCARVSQCDSGDNVQNDDTHTVYWKLGQTHEQ